MFAAGGCRIFLFSLISMNYQKVKMMINTITDHYHAVYNIPIIIIMGMMMMMKDEVDQDLNLDLNVNGVEC